MISARGMVKTLTGWLGKPLATPETDPNRWFGTLFSLPNPDPILRSMGQAEKVYFSIMADAHVIGDVRSIRGNFRSHDYRLLPGDEDDPKSVAAMKLCETWMRSRAPNAVADWLEVMWQMTGAIFSGYRVHEVVWDYIDGKYLPSEVVDRPSRRVRFDATAQPLLISRDAMLGAPVEPWQFVISRHMADTTNPYGVALLSSCFWPWTFKTGGWRYFVKYCERHGLPWPVGRYPMGTSEPEQNKLADALGNMIEAGYVVLPEGNSVELMVPTGSGTQLPQQNLIDLCNREMSKALTGQAMVSELHGVGSRAASETAAKRQNSINDSDRDIAVAGMGQIFGWITRFNLGDGIAPPKIEFYQHENQGKDRAETYQLVANMGARPSRDAMLEELGIPEAETDADALQPVLPVAPVGTVTPGDPSAGRTPPADAKPALGGPPAAIEMSALSTLAGFEFARAAGMTEDGVFADIVF